MNYNPPNAHCIRTISGKYVDLLNPDPDTIDIEDIAHALSLQPRFAGHTASHYSVARHSLFVSHIAPDELSLSALLHDAAEAYTGDIPTPLKRLLTGYDEIENRLLEVIMNKYGGLFPLSEKVKEADRAVFETEWYVLTNSFTLPYSEDSKEWFLDRFNMLK